MTENNTSNVLPETEKITEELAATTPNENSEEILVPIKFNKEVKMLSVEEAAALAQKGMKYDLISDVLDSLKSLSAENGKSVTQFINGLVEEQYAKKKKLISDKCGGDQDFAEHVLNLEKENRQIGLMGFEELQSHFPKIKSLEQLPNEVLQAAQLKGTLLLDEYLRYKLAEQRASLNATQKSKLAEFSSIGSQRNKNGKDSTEATAFLKGLWN